mmetsp:Transcript_46349/g.91888  ORF Transcript_46349/g.91888 Transcript_46349/m.91888 type:complete len:681 (-) Transcript_46349:246-2288(-)|eukprot:CAMPEP_0172725842 /NCGR_PEP_ID=MMETSP1074-20121228/89386_1 /TAXON_ID=2916 /ORGANISM="Ceratium fusus, Strain PA161109" /LENGTH=680 /DNA_ID=CAMNT_0013552713 /DNA_START=36 /DNA_END=2078 /DNA_ORIENTATION=+
MPQATVTPKAPPVANIDSDDGPIPEENALVPFDDGSKAACKAQSNAMRLVINYADPDVAAGVSVFGIGLLVMPFLARLNSVPLGANLEARDDMFSYDVHAKRNSKKLMCPFNRTELKRRLGPLDVAFMSREISMSGEAVKEHVTSCAMDAISAESEQLELWREGVNGHLTLFQKRAALAFLGLPPETDDELEIHKKYKKLALELHPDKGGDHAKFKELQQMKARLMEPRAGDDDSDDAGGGDLDEDGNIETETESENGAQKTGKRKKKRKKKKEPGLEDEEEGGAAKKQRKEMHDSMVRCWESSRNSRAEMGESPEAPDPQTAMNMLRMFIDRFVASEIEPFKVMENTVAEAKLQKFVKQGAEIIAVAAAVDMESALSTLALHFNCRLLSRNCNEVLKSKCAVLLEAAAWVPVQVGDFLNDFAEARAQEMVERAREADARRQAEADAADNQNAQDRSGPTPKRRIRMKVKATTAVSPPAGGPTPISAPTAQAAAGNQQSGPATASVNRACGPKKNHPAVAESAPARPSGPAHSRSPASSVSAGLTTSTTPENDHAAAAPTTMPASSKLVRIKSGTRPTKLVKAASVATSQNKSMGEQISDTVEADTVGLSATSGNDAAKAMEASKEEKMLRRTERWLERLAERDQKRHEKEKLLEAARMEQWAKKWCSRTKVEVQPRGGA